MSSTLEKSLYAGMVNDITIGGLVGTRVYPLIVPATSLLPAIAYQVITGSGIVAHDGATGLETKRVQLACVGAVYDDAVLLADAVSDRFRGFAGQLGIGGVQVEFCEDVNQTDGQVDEFPSGYVRYLDIVFFYKETGG